MAITVRKDPKTGKPRAYQVQVRDGGDSRSKTFGTYEEAAAFEEKMMKALRGKPSSGRTSTAARVKRDAELALPGERVADIIEAFGEANPKHVFSNIAPTVGGMVGGALVCEIDDSWTRSYCQRARKTRHASGSGFKDVTIAYHLKMLGHVIRWRAKQLGVPCPELGLSYNHLDPDWDDGRERRITPEEERRLREAIGMVGLRPNKRTSNLRHRHALYRSITPKGRHYQLLVDFALETCARQAEMVELPWSEIDLVRKIWQLPGRRTKTGRKRTIPLSPRAVEILEELAEDRSMVSERVFHRLPMRRGVSEAFTRVIGKLGIEDLRFHDLRHEAISRLIISGRLPAPAVMKMAGHKSPKMMMRYFNPQPDELVSLLHRGPGDAPSAGGLRREPWN